MTASGGRPAYAEALDFINKLPNGLDNHVSNWMEDPRGRKGSGLSGGQWQRLAMARNFYRDASFMVMDEPTSAIDALAEHRIFTRLFADRSSTIIAISHRLATIEKADIVYMLEDGRRSWSRARTANLWRCGDATSGCSSPSSRWTRPAGTLPETLKRAVSCIAIGVMPGGKILFQKRPEVRIIRSLATK
jgi:energy-coupling factor transporter ATP-binding protein EcfA2